MYPRGRPGTPLACAVPASAREEVRTAPAAFIGLVRGEDIGKMLVRVGD
jgi:NADPH-dependent curcumin reductase CurA